MPPKKLRIYKFSKVAKYEVNKQKSVAFLYINNDQSNKESMKTIPFILPSKRIKCLAINQGGERHIKKNTKHFLLRN